MGELEGATPLVGSRIAGKYEIQALLGVGGMGAVYRAVHLVTARQVALKLVHRFLRDASPNAAQRFLLEARVAASIEHPGITDILDAGEEPDGTLYLVMELLAGRSLEAALLEGLPPLRVVEVAAEILEVLAAAHARGVVHRDVKPANIFLAGSGATEVVKLLDFGIAKELGRGAEITAHGALVGTLEYMSPEQACSEPVDGRSDLWAVAALLYRGLTGRAPFAAPLPHELLRKIVSEAQVDLAELRPDLPEALCAAVRRGLEKSRDRRFPDAAAMRRALQEVDPAALRTLPPPGPRLERTELVRRPVALTRSIEPPVTRSESPSPGASTPAWSRRPTATSGIESATAERSPPARRSRSARLALLLAAGALLLLGARVLLPVLRGAREAEVAVQERATERAEPPAAVALPPPELEVSPPPAAAEAQGGTLTRPVVERAARAAPASARPGARPAPNTARRGRGAEEERLDAPLRTYR